MNTNGIIFDKSHSTFPRSNGNRFACREPTTNGHILCYLFSENFPIYLTVLMKIVITKNRLTETCTHHYIN